MKKKIFLLSALCLLEVQWSMAQAPKWVDKAKRAVFSVITRSGRVFLICT